MCSEDIELRNRRRAVVEFSRRGIAEPVVFGPVDSLLMRDYQLNPILASHYPPESTLGLSYSDYKSQVLAYLTPDYQAQYDAPEAWDAMVLRVVDALIRLFLLCSTIELASHPL